MTSKGGFRPECEAWVRLCKIDGDPLRPHYIETRITGATPDDIWKQVRQFEQGGWAALELRGTNGRI